MTSLGEVYSEGRDHEASTGRLYTGVGLFLAGALLLAAGIVVATTGVLRGGGVGVYDVREYGGILAGIGVPALFLGILIVLPADTETRAAAGVGAAIAAVGVALFAHAYPCKWVDATCAAGNLTLPTVGIYAVGTMITMWYMFVGIATFKRRNDPGGTVTMTVNRQGETKVVEVDPRKRGSVGLLGSEAETAAAGGGASTPGVSVEYGADAEVMGSASATDGGAASSDIREVGGPEEPTKPADRYCGNCSEFEYVRTEHGMQPYCAAHDELMDDMDPCESWTPNGR